MFIRKSTSTRNGKTYTNYVLVESIRTAQGPRQRAICSLGDLKPAEPGEWLKLAHRLESALLGQEELFKEGGEEIQALVERIQQTSNKSGKNRDYPEHQDIISIRVEQVCTEEHREAGSVHVGYEFWKRLGIDHILEEAGLNKRARLLSCAMTLNRLIAPFSEHAMPNWIRSTALQDILREDFSTLNEDALYRNLDKLYPKRAFIETRLTERERTLFNLDQTILLYDITSTYFEGKALHVTKAKRGYSRDKRSDCKQVLVGLVIDTEGFPKAHEVFEGNLQDRCTLEKMLDVLDKRLGLQPGQTVIVDRGMAYAENIEILRKRNLHYIVATRQSEREAFLEEFSHREEFQEIIRQSSPNNPVQKKPRVFVKRHLQEEMTYILCASDGRVEKDRAIREAKQKRFLRDVEKLARRIENGRLKNHEAIHQAIGRLRERYPTIARYYHLAFNKELNSLLCQCLEEKLHTAESLDGAYLLKTDRTDLSAEEAWRIYILLTRAEAAFRSMKSPLAERPIFHRIERRVETHIFLCILAYHLLVAIEKTLRDKGVYTSWWSIRQTLKTHQICTIVLPTTTKRTLRIRASSAPQPEHLELYRLLRIPDLIIKPQKTWSKAQDKVGNSDYSTT